MMNYQVRKMNKSPFYKKRRILYTVAEDTIQTPGSEITIPQESMIPHHFIPQHHQHPRQKKKERRRRGRRDDYIAGLSG